ncbi:MAG TPA: outer membrane protein transport protein [Burkholderiales bacterium]|nr:outer membrane protein transport protein [Burkholderiales bacterium]
MKWGKLGLACIAAGAAQGAAASGFQLIEQNASGLGNAYAGQAAAVENSSTIFFNPAGMALLPGRQVSGAVHFIGPSAKFTDNGGTRSPANAPLPAAGTNGGDAGGWIPTGNGYVSWQLTPRVWTGLGISAPFGLKTDYEASFAGRYQSRLAQFKTLDINPSIAFKVNDAFSIGGGLSYQHGEMTLERSFFAGAERPQTVKLSDSAWGWNIGALVNMSPATRIGLAYRSSIKYDLAGTVSVTGVGAAGATASVKLPDTLTWAISHQLDARWQLLGDVTYTRWSQIKNVPLVLTTPGLGASPAGTVADSLDFEFRDTYRVGIGANYKWTPDFTLKLGTAYDRTPVPDAAHRTVFLPDSDRWWLSLGGKYQLSKAATLDAGYAHLFVKDGDTFRNKRVGAAGAQGIVSGSYTNSVDIVSVQFTYSF